MACSRSGDSNGQGLWVFGLAADPGASAASILTKIVFAARWLHLWLVPASYPAMFQQHCNFIHTLQGTH